MQKSFENWFLLFYSVANLQIIDYYQQLILLSH